MKNILLLSLLLCCISVYAQDNQEKAIQLGTQAVQEMDAGNFDKAISLLYEAQKLDEYNLDLYYEMALAYYMKQDYKSATKILKPLTAHDSANARFFQMLGNSYDMMGKKQKAIEAYDEGIKLFPKSGILYLERGNIELNKSEYATALAYYETGIQVDPVFPSNYYWAAKIYLSSTEEVWGMIYGELFMNLERNTARTSEMSALLFQTYHDQIQFKEEGSVSVSFSKNATITVDEQFDPANFKLPFGVGVYEPTLLMGLVSEDKINLASLNRIRQYFVKSYFEIGHHETYPNVLFEYQKSMEENGHAEAYNYWLLSEGEKTEFNQWVEANEKKWDSFVNWFNENGLQIDREHNFNSQQYN